MTKTAQKDSLTEGSGTWRGAGNGVWRTVYSLTILRYEDIQYFVISHRTRKGG